MAQLDVSPWRRLGAAVLLQAARDAQDNDRDSDPTDARAFLTCPGARDLALALDIDPQCSDRFTGSLPAPRQPALFIL